MRERHDEAGDDDSRSTAYVYMVAALIPVAYGLLYFWSTAYETTGNGARLNEAAAVLPYADPISPLPSVIEVDGRKASLGKDLFFDPQLSSDGDVGCSTCHDISGGGDDGLSTSTGSAGRETTRNTPTVLNAAFNLTQSWDGRTQTLEGEIGSSIEDPVKMNASWPDIIQRLSRDDRYVDRFRSVYAGGLSEDAVKDALASFVRTLVTPNARFDRYLQGDEEALSSQEKRGYRLFSSAGCVFCHQGRNLGGNLYQKLGVIRSYFQGRRIRSADLGRFNVTGVQADRHVFRVPTLRNVALTAPYFHDGSVQSLENAVTLMAHHQLGRAFERHEVDAIVAFLKTFTGELPS